MHFKSKVLNDLVDFGKKVNDPSLVMDVINIFLEQAPVQVQNLANASSHPERKIQTYELHRLKTSVAVVGAEQLIPLCLEIGKLLEVAPKAASEAIEILRLEIDAECRRLEIELKRHREIIGKNES